MPPRRQFSVLFLLLHAIVFTLPAASSSNRGRFLHSTAAFTARRRHHRSHLSPGGGCSPSSCFVFPGTPLPSSSLEQRKHHHHRYRERLPSSPPLPPAFLFAGPRSGIGGDYDSEEAVAPAPTASSSTTTVASQAALIAGTTIGGGFLALPAATAPCGAGPASLGLVGVWLFLLGESLSLSDAIFAMRRKRASVGATQDDGDEGSVMAMSEKEGSVVDDDGDNDVISVFSLVRECFGGPAGTMAGLLFLLLIKVTLIAQLSKMGVLLEGAAPVLGRQLWTLAFSASMTALCLFGKQRNVERINDVLTTLMLVSFASLVVLAGGSGWSADGLARAEYRSLLPPVLSPSGSSSSFNCGPWAIPVFVQLLIYNEVVPLVASRLGDERRVRKAILLGSSVPLAMCLVWSCVALGLVPYEPSSVAAGMVYDPLSRLGDVVMSKGGSMGRVFLGSVNVLAGSAICTTVIGSILASTQYFDDVITNLIGLGNRNGGDGRRSRTTTKDVSDSANICGDGSLFRKIATHLLSMAPSAIAALYGSSDLYYRATSFAGEFPCTLLYGLVPPLCNLQFRWKYRADERTAARWGDVALQIALAMTSLGILAVSRAPGR